MRHGASSLRTRLIAAFVAVVVVSFGLATAITIFAGNRTLRGFAERDLRFEARKSLEEVDLALADVCGEIARWSRSRTMDDVLVGDAHLRVENFVLEHWRELDGRVRSLTVTDPEGAVIASTDFERLGKTLDPSPGSLIAAGDGKLRRSPFPGQHGQQKELLTVAHPVSTPFATRSIGWMVAEIEWGPIREILAESTVMSNRGTPLRYVEIVDEEGRTIAVDPRVDESTSPAAAGAYMLASTTTAPSPHSIVGGLRAVARWEKWDAYSLTRVYILGALLAALLGTVSAIAASVVIANGISRRIRDLNTGTRKMAQGDFDHRVPERGRDEVTSLARSFNIMGRQLLRSREESERATAQWRSLVENAPDVIVTVSADGAVEFMNRAVAGYRVEDILGSSVLDWILPEYHEEVQTEIDDVLRTGDPASIEVEGTGPGGSIARYSIRIGPVVRNGKVAAVNLIATDFTDRRRLEREILTVSEQERKRIGQDIHDGVGQALSGAALMCRSLARSLTAEGRPESAKAARIGEVLEATVMEARALARGLFPLDLTAEGLGRALESLAVTIDQVDGVSCRVEGEASPGSFTEVEATHLYRIAQEAVNNALRHGNARTIVIRVFDEGGHRGIEVENNGKPFTAPPAASGLGIHLMRYRAAMIGGTLQVEGSDLGGTRVRCRL